MQLDATKSPLALLALTCSSIGKDVNSTPKSFSNPSGHPLSDVRKKELKLSSTIHPHTVAKAEKNRRELANGNPIQATSPKSGTKRSAPLNLTASSRPKLSKTSFTSNHSSRKGHRAASLATGEHKTAEAKTCEVPNKFDPGTKYDKFNFPSRCQVPSPNSSASSDNSCHRKSYSTSG